MKPMTAREALLILLAVVGFYAFSRWDAKRDGKRELILAQNAQHIAQLDSSLKVERAKFRADTVTLFRRINRVDTLLSTRIDTAVFYARDTVTLTVEVVREAVATLNACRETVRSCGELRAKEQARGDSLNVRVKLLEKSRPSLAGNLMRGLTWAAGGYVVASVTRR